MTVRRAMGKRAARTRAARRSRQHLARAETHRRALRQGRMTKVPPRQLANGRKRVMDPVRVAQRVVTALWVSIRRAARWN